MPSLADLEANPVDSRLTQVYDVVLDIDLMRRVNALTEEAAALDGSQKPADKARFREATRELESLAAEVEAKSGKLTLRANLTLGEWNRFTDEHPPRPESDVTAQKRDRTVTGGVVNADALIEALDLFAAKWGDEDLAPAQRDAKGDTVKASQFDRLLRDNIPPGDLSRMASGVVLMYQGSPNFGEQLSVLSLNRERLRAFVEQEISESPRSDSPGGSPELSSVDEPETVTPAP